MNSANAVQRNRIAKVREAARKGASRLVLMPVLASFLVAASCGDGSPVRPGMAYETASREHSACRSMAGDTPEALTESYFESHINEYGVSVAANPLRCVWDRFNDQDLERYSRAGDPVATLALVIKINSREGDICNRFSNIERELWGAFQIRQVVVNGHKISRVPEVPYFIDLIAQECEVERPNLSANSIDYGFDPSSDFIVVD